MPKKEEFATADGFYASMGKCFIRNSKFAQNYPVPILGNANTPIAEVNKFYKYWDSFKTWRTFNQYDEFDENDLDHAEDRYEKRWMDKQNAKCRAQYDKAERKRIFKMVELAYENDPRLIAERVKEEAEREAKKQAKKNMKMNRYKEQEERKQNEIRMRQEKEDAEKKAKEDETLRKKEAGKLYRATCKEFTLYVVDKMPTSKYDKFYLSEMVKKFPNQEKIDALFSEIKAFKDDTFEEEFQDRLDVMNNVKKVVKVEEVKVEEKKEAALTNKTWTEEDIANFKKAIVKFKAGTNDRWRVVAAEIGKTQKEVIAKAKELQAR